MEIRQILLVLFFTVNPLFIFAGENYLYAGLPGYFTYFQRL